ncbi:MAG TPA: hypothetical protein VGF95_05105 [Solirubrobacteraceae bacterium]|jgi:dolichol kinase
MIASIVEVGKLLDVIADAIGATVGVAILFSLAVLGMTRASEQRERGSVLFAYGLLTVLCLLGSLAAVAYGIVVLARN